MTPVLLVQILTFVALMLGVALALALYHFVVRRPTVRQRIVNFFTGNRARARMVMQIGAMAFIAVVTLLQSVAANAQSIGIEFTADDLDIFFDWFNVIFNALLPIALLGAGLTAGGIFVWVIGRMLIRAFSNMMSAGAN